MAKPSRCDYNCVGSFSNRPKIIMKELNWLAGLKAFGGILKSAYKKWASDKVPRIASSLAFYIGLSLAPLLIFAVAAVGIFYSGKAIDVQIFLSEEIAPHLGQSGVEMITTILNQSRDSDEGIIASLISIGVVMFSASNLFYQMQDAFDTIWRVPHKDTKGIVNLITSRLRAVLAVLVVGLLLFAMVVLNGVVSKIETLINTFTPFFSTVLPLLNFLTTLILLTLLFTVVYRRMTQAKVRTTDVLLGGFVAALLFQVGNFALVYYLANASIGSAYGAAGSLLVVLVWFFYTMQIILFGAEVSYVYAHEYGTRRVLIDNPGPNGERVLEAIAANSTPAPPPPAANPLRTFFDNLRTRFSRS